MQKPATCAEKSAIAQREWLEGWPKIVNFLGQPVSVAQRWARTGMPVTRQGRSVVASPDELNKWLGRESEESRSTVISSSGPIPDSTHAARPRACGRKTLFRRWACMAWTALSCR